MFTRNGTAKIQIVAEQDAFRVIAYIVHAQLLSEHKIVVQNKKTTASLGDRFTGRRIRMTRSDNKFASANQIVRTNKIAWTVILRLHSSKSSRRSDGYPTVILRLHSSKFAKIGRLSDRYITVKVFEVIEKIGQSEPQA